MSAERPERRTVHYAGHVQGVGFRYTTQSIAQRFVVTGFVQNLPDRRVLLVAEGLASELKNFLAAIGERMDHHIHQALVDSGPATGEFTRFEIRH